MNWEEKQKNCKTCKGNGVIMSKDPHPNGIQPHAWAIRCKCQPKTLDELKEATEDGI